jgi:predicted MFS family arabinose efflux permease
VFAALQPFAQMMVFAVAGDWFVSDLGMSLAGLGLNTVLLGLAELGGAGIAAVASDRLGKRRTAMSGVAVAIPLAAVLGFTGMNAVVGVSVLLLMDISVELAFVAVLPLITELDPEARASAIGVAMAVVTLSRAISSIISGVVYVNWGMEANGLIASLAMLGCLLALWRWVKEPKPVVVRVP